MKRIPNKMMNGALHRFCPECDSWKVADKNHFHSSGARNHLRRKCRICFNEERRSFTPNITVNETERAKWIAVLAMDGWPTKRAQG